MKVEVNAMCLRILRDHVNKLQNFKVEVIETPTIGTILPLILVGEIH